MADMTQERQPNPLEGVSLADIQATQANIQQAKMSPSQVSPPAPPQPEQPSLAAPSGSVASVGEPKEAGAPSTPPAPPKPPELTPERMAAGMGRVQAISDVPKEERNFVEKTLGLMNMDGEERREILNGVDFPGYQKAMDQAKARYEEAVDRMGEQRALVGCFSLIGHIAAGLFGMKHGVNVSGMQFDPVDWNVEYKKIVTKYDMDREAEEKKYTYSEHRKEYLSNMIRQIQGGYESEQARRQTAAYEEWRTKYMAGRDEARDVRQEKALGLREELAEKARAASDERQMKAIGSRESLAEKSAQAKERAAVSSEFVKAASVKDADERVRLLSDIAKNKMDGMSFDEWKDAKGPHYKEVGVGPISMGWSDKDHYQEYVQDLHSAHRANAYPALQEKAASVTPKTEEVVRYVNGRPAIFNATTQSFIDWVK